MSAFSRPEWDTPPDGDFASYVERLTQSPRQPVGAAGTAQQPARAQRGGDRRKTGAAGRPAAPSPSTVSQASRAILLRLLRALRRVLAAGLLVLGALFFLHGTVSMVGLAFLGFLLWLVHAAVSALSGPASPRSAEAPPSSFLQLLWRGLQRRAPPQSSSRPRK